MHSLERNRSFCIVHSKLCMMLFSLCFLLFWTPCPSTAQKSKESTVRQELSQARTYIKPRTKNYPQAEQIVTRLLKDSANRSNKQAYQIWLEAVKGQYDQANERMYLKQKQDTAAFFNLCQRMFSVAETLDSLDQKPDKKGRIAPEYRHKYATMLNTFRPNLFNGGTYFIRKGQWQQAFLFMHTYLDCARQPLFTGYNYASSDTRMPEAAYWATYSAYKQHDAEGTLRYHQQALADTVHTSFTLQFISEAYNWNGDSLNYLQTLLQGFRQQPQFPYFFPRIIDAYTSSHQYQKALDIADEALQVCDTCQLFLFAKSSALLRMEQWDESIRYARLVMAQNDSLPEPYFNAGMAYLNKAERQDATNNRKLFNEYYQRARTYIEYYRLLMPREQDKWAPPLYKIYLNLNLGKQFDEIDKLLKSRKP